MLDCVTTAALAKSVTLPTKQFRTIGTTSVADCEQVAIIAGSVRTGLPGAGGQLIGNCPPTWSIVLSARIVRCCPVPDAKGVIAAAKYNKYLDDVASPDLAVLTEAALNFTGYSNSEASIQLSPAQGGFAATVLNMVVTF
jgi:hypothetical protein